MSYQTAVGSVWKARAACSQLELEALCGNHQRSIKPSTSHHCQYCKDISPDISSTHETSLSLHPSVWALPIQVGLRSQLHQWLLWRGRRPAPWSMAHRADV